MVSWFRTPVLFHVVLISFSPTASAVVLPTIGSPECTWGNIGDEICLFQIAHIEKTSRRSKPLAPEGAVGLERQQHRSRPSNVEQIAGAIDTAARLELLKPVAWLHIEKTGGSFLNTLVRFTSLWQGCLQGAQLLHHDVHAMHVVIMNRLRDCPSAWAPLSKECGDGVYTHIGLDMTYQINKGHIVSMFRQPEQRIISGYFAKMHSYPETLPVPSMHEYAMYTRGCQTKMLVRSVTCEKSNPCEDGIPPTPQEVRLALQRLKDGMSFVGITDQWELSICLFHAKFGGDCSPVDLRNVNPGSNFTRSRYDTSELKGFLDREDRQVYMEAMNIFEDDLLRFGVTSARCAASCWSSETGSI